MGRTVSRRMRSPLRYISGATAASTTVTMPTHAAGDMILIHVWRKTSAVAPTNPGLGWVVLNAILNPTCAAYYAYKIAASSSETVGTWTNATGMSVVVYRKDKARTWLLPAIIMGGASSNSISWPGSGSSLNYYGNGYMSSPSQSNTEKWYIRSAAHRSATNMLTNTPSSWVRRTGSASNTPEVMDSNSRVTVETTAFGGQTQAVNLSGEWISSTCAIEVWDNTGIVLIWTGSGTATALTAPFPANLKPGDLLICNALRTDSTTPPTVPSGWTALTSGTGANGISNVVAYRVATGSDSYGTWTNATVTILTAHRSYNGAWTTIDAGGANSGTAATIDLSSGTALATNQITRYLRFISTPGVWTTDPTGWTYVGFSAVSGANQNVYDSMVSGAAVGADSIGGNSVTGATAAWLTNTVRIAVAKP